MELGKRQETVEVEAMVSEQVHKTQAEVKLASLQSWIVAGLSAMFVMAVAAFTIALISSSQARKNVVEAKKKADSALACFIQPYLDRATKTLPTLQYYKDNPKELKDALADLQRNRDQALQTWGVCTPDKH